MGKKPRPATPLVQRRFDFTDVFPIFSSQLGVRTIGYLSESFKTAVGPPIYLQDHDDSERIVDNSEGLFDQEYFHFVDAG